MSPTIKENTIEQSKIMKQIASNNMESLNKLYLDYSAALFGIISSIIPQEEIAQEVLQDTFVKIWRQSAKYNSEKGRLFTWMARIARNTSIDRLRSKTYKNGTRSSNLEHFYELDKIKGFNVRVKDSGLQNVIASLDKKYAEVLDAIYYEGYTQVQTSKKLNISLGTVKTRSRTGLQMMKRLLQSEKYLWT